MADIKEHPCRSYRRSHLRPLRSIHALRVRCTAGVDPDPHACHRLCRLAVLPRPQEHSCGGNIRSHPRTQLFRTSGNCAAGAGYGTLSIVAVEKRKVCFSQRRKPDISCGGLADGIAFQRIFQRAIQSVFQRHAPSHRGAQSNCSSGAGSGRRQCGILFERASGSGKKCSVPLRNEGSPRKSRLRCHPHDPADTLTGTALCHAFCRFRNGHIRPAETQKHDGSLYRSCGVDAPPGGKSSHRTLPPADDAVFHHLCRNIHRRADRQQTKTPRHDGNTHRSCRSKFIVCLATCALQSCGIPLTRHRRRKEPRRCRPCPIS